MKFLLLSTSLFFSSFLFSQQTDIFPEAIKGFHYITIDSTAKSINRIMIADDMDTFHLCSDFLAIGKMENGKKEGHWTYRRNGGVEYSGNYVNGMKEGEWISDYEIYHYKHDKFDGDIIYYTDWDKKIVSQIQHYKNGKPDGTWIVYKQDGKTPLEIRHYRNGVRYGKWQWNFQGTIWKGPVNAKGYNGKWKIYINDTLKGGGNYVNGKQDGYWKEYWSPYFCRVGNYKNGEQIGSWQYFDTGKLTEKVFFVHGEKDGVDSIWDNGHFQGFTIYKNGNAGYAKEFYENGNLKSIGMYEADTANDRQQKINEHYTVCVPTEHDLELIERGACGWFCDEYSYEFSNFNADSIAAFLQSDDYKNHPYKVVSPYWIRTGTWTFYHENGTKKEEGEYVQQMDWVANPDVEDPYKKTGWWKIYDDHGMLIREELYENGKLVGGGE